LFETSDVFCAGTEGGNSFFITHFPETERSWFEWTAIEDQDCCAGGKGADKPGPHHPCASGELEEDILGREVAMQNMFLFKLNEKGTASVDDWFRQSCRSRGVQDHERVIECDGGKFEGFFWDRKEVASSNADISKDKSLSVPMWDGREIHRMIFYIWKDDDFLERFYSARDNGDFREGVVFATIIQHRIVRKKNFGLNLRKSIKD
jgi:hypothetical protein